MTGAQQLVLPPADPDARLRELGLDVELLHSAVRAGLVARATRTGLAPRNAQGTDLYSYTVEELRLLLAPAKWRAEFAGGQERTVSPDGLTSVIVSTGVGGVGDPDADPEPRTAHSKGPLMREAVAVNRGFVQEELGFGLPGVPVPSAGGAQPLCWVLLVRVDAAAVHLELSVPDGVGADDRVVSWAERIPLPPLARGPEILPLDDEPQLDVPVELR